MTFAMYISVVVLENELLYAESFPMSAEAQSKDFLVPFGKAKIERPGSQVTVVAYSISVRAALRGAAELEKIGIDVEVNYMHLVFLGYFH